MIVVVFGLPGSGKSYFASKLAEILRAEYVNSDRVRKQLLTKRSYSEGGKMVVYKMLFKRMNEAIDKKKDLILDATFHKSSTRTPFLSKIKDSNFFIEVQADEDIIKERLKKNRPYSEADFRVYELIKKEWEPLKEPHLILQSTNDNVDVMLANALQHLKHDPR